ncbi:MAG: lysozyme inhibitor LprI family protein [Desulfobulbia bacterium]
MRFLIFVLSVIGFGFAASAYASPSFDCAKASTKVEKIICDSADLSELDSELAEAYKIALRDSPWSSANKRIRQDQKDWLASRNLCETGACLGDLYQQRIDILRAEETAETMGTEAPENVVYCGGGQIKRQIEYSILENADGEWNAMLTINGETLRAMTAYSYFGNAEPPKGFVVALLGEDRSEALIFKDENDDWLEFGDYTYRKCN